MAESEWILRQIGSGACVLDHYDTWFPWNDLVPSYPYIGKDKIMPIMCLAMCVYST